MMKASPGVGAIGILLSLIGIAGCGSLSLSPSSTGRQLSLERIWSLEAKESNYLGARLPNRGAALVTSDLLLQGNGVDGLAAYALDSGREVWKIKVKGGVEGGIVAGEKSYYFGGGDGLLYAIDIQGNVLWTVNVKAEVTSTPTWHGGVVYVLNSNDELFALDGITGKQIWYYSRLVQNPLSLRGASSPVFWENSLFVGFSDGYLVRLESNTGKVLWEKVLSQGKKLDDVDASPVVDSGRVYASSYQVGLYCIDAETGAVLWTVDQGSDRPVVIHKNSLFYSTSDGYIMALDKHSGKQIWSHPVRGNGTTPFYDKDHLLFGESDGALVILNAVTGTKVAEFFSGRGLSARPIKGSNDIVYIISNDNNLYALRESWRPQFAKGTGALD